MEENVANQVHVVVVDSAGWGYTERFTCETCMETLVRQPWMTSDRWRILVSDFMHRHPARRAEGKDET